MITSAIVTAMTRRHARPRGVTIGWAAVLAWTAGLAALLLWPITRAGYPLGHDLVFTPQQPLGLDSIGVSSASPRAVPVDALVALAEKLLDGAVVGRLALILPLVAAGVGVAALLGGLGPPAQLAAVTVAVWNPYVVERLALGQWALLWAYAALPWIVLAVRLGSGAAGWFALAAGLAAASITPTGGVIAAAVAVAAALGVRLHRQEVLTVAGLAVVLQLPWVMPALVSGASATSDPAAVTAFAARAEHGGGRLLSLLDGGGIWDAAVVPGSRSGALPWVGLAVLVAAAFYGAPVLARTLGRRLVLALTAVAAAGLLLAVMSSLPGGSAVVRAVVEHVPGGGLLRDAQKWVLPLVGLEALLVGAAVHRLWERLHAVPYRALLVVAAMALPLVVLPDAAATVRPTLEPAHYPRDWRVVAQRLGPGEAAVLPWGSYRRFAWVRSGSVLDPAPRLLPGPTVVDDRLVVSGHLLGGENPHARAVGTALDSAFVATGLARLGVAWIVVEHGTPGRLPDLTGFTLVYRGADVSLYRVPGTVRVTRPSTARVTAVVAADVLALLVLAGLAGSAGVGVVRAGAVRRKARSAGHRRC